MSVKCLIYCSKGKPYLYKTNFVKIEDIKKGIWDKLVYEIDNNERLYLNGKKKEKLNGKIVASFDCEKVEEFNCCCVPYRKENNLGYELFIDNGVYKVEWKENINLRDEEKRYNNPENYKDDGVVFERKDRYIDTMLKNDDLEKAKLSPQQLLDYISLGKEGYAIHISNLQVFDEPKELSDYLVFDGDYTDTDNWKTNQYAPQNMKNVYEFCSSNDVISPKRTLKKCVLISIKPEWVCKILNGEKTIEVRKQVVKKLKELKK